MLSITFHLYRNSLTLLLTRLQACASNLSLSSHLAARRSPIHKPMAKLPVTASPLHWYGIVLELRPGGTGLLLSWRWCLTPLPLSRLIISSIELHAATIDFPLHPLLRTTKEMLWTWSVTPLQEQTSMLIYFTYLIINKIPSTSLSRLQLAINNSIPLAKTFTLF